MKKILIAGNWKMNTNLNSSTELCLSIAKALEDKELLSNVLICPPFTNLGNCSVAIKGTAIVLGAQNCWYEDKGAFTGEISLEMLKSVGCTYCITGHSERRTIFGETDEIINKKTHSILRNGLIPIVCIGETLEERNAGKTYDVLFYQLDNSLKDIAETDWQKVVIAYEPVWAIGTGVTATPEQAQEAHFNIRNYLNEKFGSNAAKCMILYGGSMNEKNALELLSLPDINGGLIGGASLKAESFVSIINSAEKVLRSE